MKELTVIKLNFKQPVHLGEAGVGVENISPFIAHSDTLWAALISAWSRLFNSPDPLIPLDNSWEPPLLLSSAFPYVENTFFFPKPLNEIPVNSNTIEYHKIKKLKKAPLIPQDIFQKWISGTILSEEDIDEIISSNNLLSQNIITGEEPHVQLGHAAFYSRIYYLGIAFFSEESGLYFMIEFKDSVVKEKFFSSLELLSEDGLGGRRNYGLGAFTFDVQKISIDIPNTEDSWITLSRIFPEDKLIDYLPGSRYKIYNLKGWAFSSNYKSSALRKPINLLVEGSIFPVKPSGAVVDITPFEDEWDADHRVLRHGLSFPLPFKEASHDR